MGNICRSPSAQGVFEKLIKNKDLGELFSVDSAGTHSYHIGAKPDSRSATCALKRGVDLSCQRARKISSQDFEDFDYIVVMDNDNYMNVRMMCPKQYHHKIHKMMSFAPSSKYKEVPDPYYGGDQGFELVLDLLENASIGLYQHIVGNEKLRPIIKAIS